jgi:hypothetical protein
MFSLQYACIGMVTAIVVVATPGLSTAQGLTGTLAGSIQDQRGGVLPGAIVRVESAALFGGALRTTSNESGQFRFPVLPPGTYALTVELFPAFASYRDEGLTVAAGVVLNRTVVLALAAVSESMTVRATSRLDAQGGGLETHFFQEDLETIPTRRFSMFDFIRSAPGISPTSPTSGTVNTVSAFGSAVNENAFLIDGTNFTCPCQGVSRAEPSVDVIQEIDVQSTGASVEFGNIQGAVFNVITRQGGNRYQYDASYYGQTSGLTARPVLLPASNGSSTGYDRIEYRDATSNFGGPIVHDRLWFFGGYQYLRDYDSQPGTDPSFPRKYEQNKYFGKLTYELTPRLHLTQSFHEEVWNNPALPTVTTPFVATQLVHASVPSMTLANLTHELSDKTFWEVRLGRFSVDQTADPSSGDRTTPSHKDQITNVVSANAPQIDATFIERVTAKAVIHRYQAGWLGADHDVKIGGQFERGQHHSVHAFPGGVQYVDSNGAPLQAVFRAPWIGGGLNDTSAVFASDTFSVTGRFNVDAGVRFDHSRAISPDLGSVDALGHEVDGITRGLGDLYSWNVVSPRLGMTVKLTRDGRTVARANYGRFNQGVLTGELEPFHPGATPIRTMAYDPSTGDYTKLVSIVDSSNLALDPHTRTPRTDEYSIAVDRELAPRLLMSAAYIRKRGANFIGWVDSTGQYQPATWTLGNGTVVPVFSLQSPTSARRFLLTNPDNFSMEYDGLVVLLEKRLSKGWQASASYAFSRSYGLQVTSNAAVSEAQFSTIARPTFLTFGQDPNDLTNSQGRLLNDRPHVFRATSTGHLWRSLLVAANVQYFSGRPWAATAQVKLPQSGRQRILIEPRGSERLPSQAIVDLRVAKTLPVGREGTVELRFDVLNAVNDDAAETLQSDVLFDSANVRNPTFGLPATFVDPRRAMLSVRLKLGR